MKRRTAYIVAATGIAGIPQLACAATATPPASPVTGQMMSLVLSTLIVVAIIVAAAWLLKRMAPSHYSRGNMLRVVAGAAVGQRERVVVVEIGATWLVLGVAPGHVNVLHQLPRSEQPAELENAQSKPRTFAQWLTVVTGKTK